MAQNRRQAESKSPRQLLRRRIMDNAIWTIVGVFIGTGCTLIGVMQTRDANKLERDKTVIEWQARRESSVEQMVELSEEYSSIAAIPGAHADPASQKRIDELERRVSSLRELYDTIETSLAEIQGRAPRPAPKIEFRPLGGPGRPGLPTFTATK
jgi:hypothetical protein